MQVAANTNFTGSVNKELLKRAKIIAAKTDTSINALFNAELRYLVETFDAAEKSGNQNYKSLLDFSLGNADELTTLGKLGIEHTEDLFLLMAQARLPMPRLADSVTQGMVEKLALLPTAP
jgi:hypothetical protein